eukprot:TRINITY_DN14016_c0_g1_i2.p1 TRINITY_DN14016_c0_g1~~TRINITY_DN14016_c0_g1_i2.p1  ORF type:complete len:348 (+),score=91.95 TRINITY_DN14016_c0_g1_i2:68-1111(+)
MSAKEALCELLDSIEAKLESNGKSKPPKGPLNKLKTSFNLIREIASLEGEYLDDATFKEVNDSLSKVNPKKNIKMYLQNLLKVLSEVFRINFGREFLRDYEYIRNNHAERSIVFGWLAGRIIEVSKGELLMKGFEVFIKRFPREMLEWRNEGGFALLHFAAKEGNVECIKMLLAHTSPQYREVKDNDGMNALHSAAQSGNANVIRALLEDSSPKFREMKDNHGFTALHSAAQLGHADCIKALLKDSSPEFRTIGNQNNFNPLHGAAQNVNVECIKALLEDSSPEYREMKDIDGATPLLIVAEHGCVKCINLLLKGASPMYRFLSNKQPMPSTIIMKQVFDINCSMDS